MPYTYTVQTEDGYAGEFTEDEWRRLEVVPEGGQVLGPDAVTAVRNAYDLLRVVYRFDGPCQRLVAACPWLVDRGERAFPVLGHRCYPAAPISIPWRLLTPHEAQAKRNHGGQDLETLARRGGLSPGELVAVLEDRRYHVMPPAAAVQVLRDIVRARRGVGAL